MGFNIDIIKGIMDFGQGPAKENTYEVVIRPPRALVGWNTTLRYLCDSAELPGRQIMTTPQVIYGAQRKMPYAPMYNDLSLTFICTNIMAERKQFESWQSAIQDPTNNYMNYYEDYVGDLTIVKFNDQNAPSHFIVCEEVFPILIESQPLSWQPSAEKVLGLRVGFAYLKWRSQEDIIRSEQAEGERGTSGYKPDLNAIPADFNEGAPLETSPVEFPAQNVPQINRPERPINNNIRTTKE